MLIIVFAIKGIVHKGSVLQAKQSVTFHGNCVTMCENFAPNFRDKAPGWLCLLLAVAPHPTFLKTKLEGRHLTQLRQNRRRRRTRLPKMRAEGGCFEGEDGQ
jgi:hypothetical protein